MDNTELSDINLEESKKAKYRERQRKELAIKKLINEELGISDRESKDKKTEKLLARLPTIVKNNKIADVERFESILLYHLDVDKALKEYRNIIKKEFGSSNAKLKAGNKPKVKKVKKIKELDIHIKPTAYVEEITNKLNSIAIRLKITGAKKKTAELIDILASTEINMYSKDSVEFINHLIENIDKYRYIEPLSAYYTYIITKYKDTIINEVEAEITNLSPLKNKTFIQLISLSSTYINILDNIGKGKAKVLYDVAYSLIYTNIDSIRNKECKIREEIVKKKKLEVAKSKKKENRQPNREKEVTNKRRSAFISTGGARISNTKINEEKMKVRLLLNTPISLPKNGINTYKKFNTMIPMDFVRMKMNDNLTILKVLETMLSKYDLNFEWFIKLHLYEGNGSIGDSIGLAAIRLNMVNIRLMNNMSECGLFALYYTIHKYM